VLSVGYSKGNFNHEIHEMHEKSRMVLRRPALPFAATFSIAKGIAGIAIPQTAQSAILRGT